MNIQTPVIFSDGTNIFEQLKRKYITHKNGLFILASSGTGKTYYVNNQKDRHWIDGDDFWPLTNADPLHDDWEHDFEIVMEVNNRCDVMTYQAKKQGLWIVGSSNSWLKPDAIVILEESVQKKYIQARQKNNFDGGATEEDLDGIRRHNLFIQKWAEHGVPQFSSVQAATNYFIDLELL